MTNVHPGSVEVGGEVLTTEGGQRDALSSFSARSVPLWFIRDRWRRWRGDAMRIPRVIGNFDAIALDCPGMPLDNPMEFL
ncbi:MAG: hypothetical protein D6812_09060 [Deltaproteobacteria bacterium]|nr:MAG: hypothetical protein D6812_09060 [Deltaproteobacteria bacterium]